MNLWYVIYFTKTNIKFWVEEYGFDEIDQFKSLGVNGEVDLSFHGNKKLLNSKLLSKNFK